MTSPSDTSSTDATIDNLMRATSLLVRRVRAQNLHELSVPQSQAMSRLAELGAATTADLARAESMRPQSMAPTLAALEQEGLVERQPHPTDGRQVLFRLTSKGIETRRINSVAKRAWMAAAIEQLSPSEQVQLAEAARLLWRLANS